MPAKQSFGLYNRIFRVILLREQKYSIGDKKYGSTEKTGTPCGVKSFLGAIAVVAALMVLTYALTFFIPGGEYARIVDAAGNTVIDPAGGFTYVEGGLPLWKWLLTPVLVLGADGGGMIAAVLVFLLVIGGVFNCLEICGLMRYLLDRLVHRFAHSRYRLMAVIVLFFVAMGAFIGSFEECVPLVPIVVSLALGLVDVNYTDWVKFSWKFQLLNLVLTSGLLLLGLAVGYA